MRDRRVFSTSLAMLILRASIASLGTAVLLSGCASGRSSGLQTDSALARRATALRGATDAQWDAIRYGHDQGKRFDSVYVFTIAELRTGALRAQTMAVIGTDADQRETEAWLTEAEAALPKVIAEGPSKEVK